MLNLGASVLIKISTGCICTLELIHCATAVDMEATPLEQYLPVGLVENYWQRIRLKAHIIIFFGPLVHLFKKAHAEAARVYIGGFMTLIVFYKTSVL